MSLNPSQQGNEYHSHKRAADYLGLRYDHSKQSTDTSDRLLEDISTKFDDYVWSPNSNVAHTQKHCSSTTERSDEKLESNLKLPFKATYQGLKLGAEYSSQTTGKVTNSNGTIVYTVFRIDSRQCTYKQIPPLKALIQDDTIDRGTYVKSVWMNTWYKINFIIKFDKQKKTDEATSGYGLNAGYQKIAKLDLKKGNLEDKLKNKKIQKITVEIEGLSDFQLTVPDGPLSTVKDINKKCALIEQDYLNKFNCVSARAFFVDPSDCLGLTSEAPLPKPLPPPQLNRQSIPPVIAGQPDFLELSRSIFSCMTPAYKDTFESILGEIKLFEMIASLENVFKFAFQHSPLIPKTSSMIFGVTGDGKSTFIGYKNGAKLSLEKDDNGNLAYCYSKEDEMNFPPMGKANESSKTKGYAVYGNTIDTAGFFDRRGKAEELCNKMALDFAIESCKPGYVTIVLNPSKLDSRGTGFFQLMEKLNQFLKNPSHPDTFSSTLFVFNEIIKKPTNELETIEDIKRNINNKIEQLKKEIDADLEKYSSYTDKAIGVGVSCSNLVGFGAVAEKTANYLKGEDWAKRKAEEIKNIDPIAAENVTKNLEMHDLLQQLKNSKNIIVADFRDGKTLNEIKKWEQEAPKLLDDAFNTSKAVDNTRLPFFESLKVIVSYFNDQFRKAKGLENDKRNLKDSIRQTKNIIAQIPDGIIPTDEDMEKYNKLKEQEEDAKIIQEGLKITAEKNIKALSEKQARLTNATNKKLLQNLCPTTPITPRSRWAYFDCTAKKYFFDYKGITLVDHAYVKPTENEKYPGTFINLQKIKMNKEETNINQCTFQATYLPGYHSLEKDQDAVVELYVEKKDHPKTIGKINSIVMVALPEENKALNQANREIIRLNGAIANWDLNIQSGTNALRQKTLKDGYENNLNDYRIELSKVRQDLTKINTELATYKDYCQLLREILVNFQLQKMLPSQDDNLADEFIFNFPKK